MTGEAPDLQPGDSGDWVVELQRLLRALGHLDHDPDGTFGDTTALALAAFQAAAGLPTEPTVTRDVWTALYLQAPTHLDPALAEQPGGLPSGQASEDGQWVWDGERWVGAGDGQPEPAHGQQGEVAGDGVGQLSEDRQWRWDGVEWQPANS